MQIPNFEKDYDGWSYRLMMRMPLEAHDHPFPGCAPSTEAAQLVDDTHLVKTLPKADGRAVPREIDRYR